MSNARFTVLIKALKKTVAFQDDLVKKLDDISLIQRAINKAVDLTDEKSDIHILTDSEEIRLIAERNGVKVFWDPALVWCDTSLPDKIGQYLKTYTRNQEYTLWLSPYAPLLTVELINEAKKALIESRMDLLKPIRQVKRHIYDQNGQSALQAVFGDEKEEHTLESRAFVIMRSGLLTEERGSSPTILPWIIEHDLIEIESYQDWWICEKLLGRKRIVFRVIGNDAVGMGHIYRALSLAHEITDHEIFFVSDHNNAVAVNKLAGYDYWLGIYDENKVVANIIDLKPDLVINDILSTTGKDLLPLQKKGIKVVNFEDTGEGAQQADLTINELYDKPQCAGKDILWGHQYFFVRDEFNDARAHHFTKLVDSILLTFGGTDQHDLSSKIYRAIYSVCQTKNIRIYIVTGFGYAGFSQLMEEVKGEKSVTLTRSTGVISSIMEKCQIAIVSNGRTVYELAHMNIPGIVISQHKREKTHGFSCQKTGFIPLDIYEKGKTETAVVKNLEKLIDDEKFRLQLFERTKKYRFNRNKTRVLKRILELLD